MSSIKIIDRYTLHCSNGAWTEDQSFTAKCLNIEDVNGTHVVDIRVVSKKALLTYLKVCFPYIMSSIDSKSYRDALFVNLKEMYSGVYNDFMGIHYPKTKYIESVGRDLYKHQLETLSTSVNRKYNFLALEQGLGKTLTAATLSKIVSAKRTVIICPNLVKYNWLYDMTRDWGYNELYWTILDAKKNKSIFAFRERFVVLNFEQVARQMDYLLRDRVDHIIIDEIHYLKNHNSARSKAVRKFIELAGNPRLTMMSGTPVTNRIVDMFAYLKMAHHPLGKNFELFKTKYTISADVRGGKVIGSKNIDDLKNKISNLFIRLKSEDCLDLPDMIIKNYYFDVDEIAKEYQEQINTLRSKKERYDSLHGKEKAMMSSEIKANIHTLNRLVTTAKVPKIKELIDSLIEQGEKVVVFSGYKSPLEQLELIYGDKCVKIDGSVDSHKRQMLIDRFRDKESCKVFLGNYQAAGVGINLVNANHVIMMNMPFVPAEIEQAQKRLHRGGQKRRVFVYYTLARETIDDHIYSIIIDKSQDINALIDGNHKGVINYSNITKELFRKLLETKNR